MTDEQERAAGDIITRLHEALKAARVSAVVKIVDVNGEPKLRIASHEHGEALQRLNAAVAGVLRSAGTDHRYLGTLERRN